MTKFKKVLSGAALAGASSVALAADPVIDAFTSIATTVGTYAASLIALAVASTVIMIGVKWVKKARSAA